MRNEGKRMTIIIVLISMIVMRLGVILWNQCHQTKQTNYEYK